MSTSDIHTHKSEIQKLTSYRESSKYYNFESETYELNVLIKNLKSLKELKIKENISAGNVRGVFYVLSGCLFVAMLSIGGIALALFVLLLPFYFIFSKTENPASSVKAVEQLILELTNLCREKEKNQKSLLTLKKKLNDELSWLKIKATTVLEGAKIVDDSTSHITKAIDSKLPFYISNHQSFKDDSLRWNHVKNAINNKNTIETSLYLVKIKNLLDNKEFYKVGVTTQSTEERFENSTQVELLENITTLKLPYYLALYLEYVFIKEFRLTDELAELLKENSVSVKFSGFTEIVRPNSISKIKQLLLKIKESESVLINSYNSAYEEMAELEKTRARLSDLNIKISKKEKELQMVNSQINQIKKR